MLKYFGLLILVLAFALSSKCQAKENSKIVARVLRGDILPKKELISNGGFEEGEEVPLPGWNKFDLGYEVDKSERHKGAQSIKCTNLDVKEIRGGRQVLELNRKDIKPLIASGWSKALNVSGSKDSNYSIYVDIIYQDGTPLWGQTAQFSCGTHDWEYKEVIIRPTKPIKTLNIYTLFRHHQGTVWFDDVSLFEIVAPEGTSSLDETLIIKTKPAPSPSLPTVSISTQDGLVLCLTKSGGYVQSLKVDGSECSHKSTVSSSGFFVRDMAENSDFIHFGGILTKEGNTILQKSEITNLGLALDVSFTAKSNHIEVKGKVRNLKDVDRAISLYFALPINALGWLWWDDVRTSKTIEKDKEYKNLAYCGVGATGRHSLYYFSALSHPKSNLSLAIPFSEPRIVRIAYNSATNQYYVCFDFGLTKETAKFPNSASFSFIIYKSDPNWGFRAAVKKYYEIHPEFFVKRVEKEGIWMPFSPISQVEDYEDFGFMFHEGPPNEAELKFDNEKGIYTFRYTEPMSFWQSMKPEIERTYDNCIKVLEENCNSENKWLRNNAWAVKSCGAQDEDGKFVLDMLDTPWCNGCVFTLNNDPDIPDNPEQPNKAHINYDIKEADNRYSDTSRGIWDGEYLDSLEGWGLKKNFRKDHFKYVDVPLTFDTETKRPVLLQIFSTYEFTKYISQDIHRRGKLMMANAVPWNFGFLCHLLDIMGTETNWVPGGQWRPEGDDIMNFRRTICYQRPYLLLMNSNYSDLNHERVEAYMKRCTLYGIFPSMFDELAASKDPYWASPKKWYNRDRDLFKRYIPVIKQIAQAGWEPITYGETDDLEIFVERYGYADKNNLHFVIFNNSKSQKDFKLKIHAKSLGIKGKEIRLSDLFSGRSFRATVTTGVATLLIDIQGEDVMVLKVSAE